MVDFDQAEYNGFERSVGAKITEKITRGCTVHWKTSVNCVSDIVTKSKDEHIIFRYLGHNIPDFKEQGDVTLAFDVLCGRKCIAEARHLLPQHLADICDVFTNIHWAKSVYWVKWWSRERIQRMSCKASTLRDSEEWDANPNTNNPVESLNRQSIAEGCRNISVLMKNIYLEDRLHAVKIVASEQNINISYENNSQEEKERKRKKRKRSRLSFRGTSSSLNETEAQMDQTPPDKRRQLEKRTSKKKLAETMIWENRVRGECGRRGEVSWLDKRNSNGICQIERKSCSVSGRCGLDTNSEL